jgi:hypothetical protein
MNEVYPDDFIESIQYKKQKTQRYTEPYTSLRRRRRAIYYTESEARITIRSI